MPTIKCMLDLSRQPSPWFLERKFLKLLLYYLLGKGGQSSVIRWKEDGLANEAIMVKPNVNLWTVRRDSTIL